MISPTEYLNYVFSTSSNFSSRRSVSTVHHLLVTPQAADRLSPSSTRTCSSVVEASSPHPLGPPPSRGLASVRVHLPPSCFFRWWCRRGCCRARPEADDVDVVVDLGGVRGARQEASSGEGVGKEEARAEEARAVRP
jgi:hypothetical protein